MKELFWVEDQICKHALKLLLPSIATQHIYRLSRCSQSIRFLSLYLVADDECWLLPCVLDYGHKLWKRSIVSPVSSLLSMLTSDTYFNIQTHVSGRRLEFLISDMADPFSLSLT